MWSDDKMKTTRVVMYPSPGVGHLRPMVGLANALLQLNPSLSITVLITETPFYLGSTSTFIERLRSSTISSSSISFLHLPPIVDLPTSTSKHYEDSIFSLIRLSAPNVRSALLSLSPVRALVYDFFCHPALDAASALSVPAHCFFTSPASVLALFLHLPTLHRRSPLSFKDYPATDAVRVPGVPSFPADHMFFPVLDRADPAYSGFLSISSAFPRAASILLNSFDSLEPRALAAISAGECLPDAPTPPVYCVGPIFPADTGGDGADCLAWLDAQPQRSVVFLCFGSLGAFSAPQLREIAVGLEASGQRFLWVVRSPPPPDSATVALAKEGPKPPPDPELSALLPEGFLERTSGRGLVVKSWAPQAAVLKKEAVAGFVSHCGWNSVLEAVIAGVAMVAWPLYAEQKVNGVVLVEELKLAMKIEGAEKGWVEAEEVARTVTALVESEEGEALRRRAAVMMEEAAAALSEGGSSRRNLEELLQAWTKW